jgi:tRNA pseudouridine13 synthase
MGDYLFYDFTDEKDSAFWLKTFIPTVSSKMKIEGGGIKKIWEDVLAQNCLKAPMFNLTKIRQAYFKSALRPAAVIPTDLTAKMEPDEIHAGRMRISLKFFLPRGSFATMLIKRLFSQ